MKNVKKYGVPGVPRVPRGPRGRLALAPRPWDHGVVEVLGSERHLIVGLCNGSAEMYPIRAEESNDEIRTSIE